MTVARRAITVTTRQAVTRILGSADCLPERSKASKVLTIVACRLQLFVFELERARYEHFGLGVEKLLDRLHEHCQLLGVASSQGHSVQSGYALLAELLALLRELEASVLLLPGKLGGDARYKPALDELQALLANVSYYRVECEQTKRDLEAALSELVQANCTAPFSSADAHVMPYSVEAGDAAKPASSERLAEQRGATHIDIATANAANADGAASAPDLAVLQRVRQAICALDLDVEMADRNQDLDEELLQLRDQMQQALQGQEKDQRDEEGQSNQQQPLRQLDEPPLDAPAGRATGRALGPARLGARRRREQSADAEHSDEDPSASSMSSASASWASLLSASSLPPGPASTSAPASRLHAARHVSRRLAAQHLARLKEQRRQLRHERSAGGGAARDVSMDVPPAAQRRRLQGGPAEAPPSAPADGGAVVLAPARGDTPSSPLGNGLAALEVTGLTRGGGETQSHPAEEPESPASPDAAAPGDADGNSAATTAAAAAADDDDDDNRSRADDPRVGNGAGNRERAIGDSGVSASGLRGPAASHSRGPPELPQRQEFLAGRHSGGGTAGIGIGAMDMAFAAVPLPRSIEASVAALRKLNRVTTLAGMWEAGRPVAQQGSAEDDDDDAGGGAGVGAGGSASDCEEAGSSRGEGSLGGGGACELPARPAVPRRLAVAGMTAAPPPQLPPLPGQIGDVAASSPFMMLALQGKAPKAPPPPVLGRLLAPSPLAAEVLLEETPASPSAPRGDAAAGGAASGNNSPLYGAAAAAAGAPGAQRLRIVAAAGAAGGAPAPLPLPDASVHLRAVGLPGCLPPHWAPPGAFGVPAALHPAGGGPWFAGGDGDGSGGGGGSGGVGRQGEVLLDFGPDVPTLDLHRDITGWGPCLGRGAFGAVYKALFRNKPAAVKVLHGGALDVRDMRSLRTEISLLCRLRHHPNIITVYGAAAAPPDHVALVTELMDCDLYDYIHRRRQNCVPLDEVLSIARAIAAGLSELHPAIVHRDLKPANVLLRHSAPTPPPPAQLQQQQTNAAPMDRRLTVKIADFGLARHKRSQYLSTRERDAGTLKYMAPECIASGNGNDGGEGASGGGGINEKCDIYSFGVLLYELITGREPWEGCHPLYAVCQVQSGATLQLPDDPGRCPPPLRALVLRCWSYQHHQRPSSRELLRELDEMIAGKLQKHPQTGGGRTSGGGAEGAAPAILWQ